MRIDNLNLLGKMFKNISPDSVWSGRTSPANLGVGFCLVRKFIWPVQLSPSATETGLSALLLINHRNARMAFLS